MGGHSANPQWNRGGFMTIGKHGLAWIVGLVLLMSPQFLAVARGAERGPQ